MDPRLTANPRQRSRYEVIFARKTVRQSDGDALKYHRGATPAALTINGPDGMPGRVSQLDEDDGLTHRLRRNRNASSSEIA